ncbi:unnamed protein product [Gongylonema pulchrum]|uniref:Uncharacterized protein n=1 Tax=Gongylonema pulchrum TaxID=637853 RepID=A0A183EH76_9BILA|nr:unnamed protein product [Gongylonema pulchrum]
MKLFTGKSSLSLLILLFLLLLLISSIPYAEACLLCFLRLPPRPRSIDHLWLSALEDVNLPDTAAEMCQISRDHLPFRPKCRQGLAKIFCSLSDFLDNNWKECYSGGGEDGFLECANCSLSKLKILQQTSWVVTCKVGFVGKNATSG